MKWLKIKAITKALGKILHLVQLKEGESAIFGLLQFLVIEGRLSSLKSAENFYLKNDLGDRMSSGSVIGSRQKSFPESRFIFNVHYIVVLYVFIR